MICRGASSWRSVSPTATTLIALRHFMLLCFVLANIVRADVPPLLLEETTRGCSLLVVQQASAAVVICGGGVGAVYFGDGVSNRIYRCELSDSSGDIAGSPAVAAPSFVEVGPANGTVSRCMVDPVNGIVIVVNGNQQIFVFSEAGAFAADAASETATSSVMKCVLGCSTSSNSSGSIVMSVSAMAALPEPGNYVLSDMFAHRLLLMTVVAANLPSLDGLQTSFSVFAGDPGSGEPGDSSGGSEDARLRAPFALAAVGTSLFFADRSNGGLWRLRHINITTRFVSPAIAVSSSVVGAYAIFTLQPVMATDKADDPCTFLLLDPGSSALSRRIIAAPIRFASDGTLRPVVTEVIGIDDDARVAGFVGIASSGSITGSAAWSLYSVGISAFAGGPFINVEFHRFVPPERNKDTCHVNCEILRSASACSGRFGCMWNSSASVCVPACWTFRSPSSCLSRRYCAFDDSRGCHPSCAAKQTVEECDARATPECWWNSSAEPPSCQSRCPWAAAPGSWGSSSFVCHHSCTAAGQPCLTKCDAEVGCGAVGHCATSPDGHLCLSACKMKTATSCMLTEHCMYPSSSAACTFSCSLLNGSEAVCTANPICFSASLAGAAGSSAGQMCRRRCENIDISSCAPLPPKAEPFWAFANRTADECLLLVQNATASRGQCIQNCNQLMSFTDCALFHATCFWWHEAPAMWPSCNIKCSLMDAEACAPYCLVPLPIHHSRQHQCFPDCENLHDEHACHVNECLWSNGRCRLRCGWLSFDACMEQDHCTTMSMDLSRWHSASQCAFTCITLDRQSCSDVPHCYWSGVLCQDRCRRLPEQGIDCGSKHACYTGPGGDCFQDCALLSPVACATHEECELAPPGRCRNRCTSVAPVVIDSGVGVALNGSAYSCRREDCIVLAAPTRCMPLCFDRTDAAGCGAEAECRWNNMSGMCTHNCTSLTLTQCVMAEACAPIDEDNAPSSPQRCVTDCSVYNSAEQCAAAAPSRCWWDAVRGRCAPQCSAYPASPGCPRGCATPAMLNSWATSRCAVDCSELLDAPQCIDHGCLWTHSTCAFPCEKLAAEACGAASHCYMSRSSVSEDVREACLVNCQAFDEFKCNSFSAKCTWAGHACVPMCSSINTSIASCPVHPFDGGFCVNGSSGMCVQRCELLENSTCEKREECVWAHTNRCELRCAFANARDCEGGQATTRCFSGRKLCTQNCSSIPHAACMKHSECIASPQGVCRNKCMTINPVEVAFGTGFVVDGKAFSCERDDCSFLPRPNQCFPRCERYTAAVECTADDCAWLGDHCAPRCSDLSEIQCSLVSACGWSDVVHHCRHRCELHLTPGTCDDDSDHSCSWDESGARCGPTCLVVPSDPRCKPAASVVPSTAPESQEPAQDTSQAPTASPSPPPPSPSPSPSAVDVSEPSDNIETTTESAVTTPVPGPATSMPPQVTPVATTAPESDPPPPPTVPPTPSQSPTHSESSSPTRWAPSVSRTLPSRGSTLTPTRVAHLRSSTLTELLTAPPPPITAAPGTETTLPPRLQRTQTTTVVQPVTIGDRTQDPRTEVSTADPSTEALATADPATEAPTADPLTQVPTNFTQKTFQLSIGGGNWSLVLLNSSAVGALRRILEASIASALGTSVSHVNVTSLELGSLLVSAVVTTAVASSPQNDQVGEEMAMRLRDGFDITTLRVMYLSIVRDRFNESGDGVALEAVAFIDSSASSAPTTGPMTETPPPSSRPPTEPERVPSPPSACNTSCIGGIVGGIVGLCVVVVVACVCWRNLREDKKEIAEPPAGPTSRHDDGGGGADELRRVSEHAADPYRRRLEQQSYQQQRPNRGTAAAAAAVAVTSSESHQSLPSLSPRVQERAPSSLGGDTSTSNHITTEQPVHPVQTQLLESTSPTGAAVATSDQQFVAPGKSTAMLPATTGEWECGVCTYKNEATRVVCEICESPRSSAEPRHLSVERPSTLQLAAAHAPQSPTPHGPSSSPTAGPGESTAMRVKASHSPRSEESSSPPDALVRDVRAVEIPPLRLPGAPDAGSSTSKARRVRLEATDPQAADGGQEAAQIGGHQPPMASPQDVAVEVADGTTPRTDTSGRQALNLFGDV